MRRILLLVLLFITLSLTDAFGQTDEKIQAAVQKAVHSYSLRGIQSSVQSGTVTLTGFAELCRDKLLAIETVKRIPGVKDVEDRIEVPGPSIPDVQLKAQIDRIIAERLHKLGGFGFGAMMANVRGGVVTHSGTAAPELTRAWLRNGERLTLPFSP